MTLAQSPLHSPANPGLDPQRLDPRRGPRAVRAAVPRADVRGRPHPPDAFRSDRGADLDAAVDQDRRLPGGLRLLPAGGALRHRRRRRKADEPRRRAGRGARRQGRRRQPLLHGRGLALAEGPRRRERLRDGRGREGARPGDLRHARHADAGAGDAAEAARPRLLQPQPRHLAGVLRRDHHHPHLPGSARHARRGARGRHPRLLRRHRRHGRGRGGPRRHDRDAGEPAGASGERADQHAGAGRGHAARGRARSSIRWSSCAPSRSRASPCRSRWCGSPPGART